MLESAVWLGPTAGTIQHPDVADAWSDTQTGNLSLEECLLLRISAAQLIQVIAHPATEKMTPEEAQMFFQIHSGLPREGPGSKVSTQRAFNNIEDLPGKPMILDIGCGPGAQTLELAQLSTGLIYALDNHGPFIEGLKEQVRRLQLTERVFPLLGDMRALPFDNEHFDLLWAEGSIYIIGVEQGLMRWRPYLKKRGYVAFSDVAWLRENPPEELRDFWSESYSGISTIEHTEKLIERTGFELQKRFVLPESDWWDEYYRPIEERLPRLLEEHRQDPSALRVIETGKKEIDLYRKYSSYYGYVFYVARRNDA
jgi:SAM-dependent methyltransferase